MKRTQVIVVGAGPTGSIAAYALACKGIDVVLIEAHPDYPEDMRASTFHPPTLEMLQEFGLLDALAPQGLQAPVYQYRNRTSGEVLSFDLTEIADVLRYPYRLQCEQYKLSRLIGVLLDGHAHATVLRGHRLVHVEQDATGVSVAVEGTFEILNVRADFMVAADGANSFVRKWLDVPFEGFTYPEKFLTLSTTYPAEEHFEALANVNYVADETEWFVLLRVPTLWRVLVPATNEQSDAELRSDEKRNQVFGGLFGADGREAETYHRTVYRVHQRVAQSFRRGRILLAGDAAHLNNPLGGLGMNSGIHDAVNLTGKLAQILLEGAPADALLDRYDRQRRTIMNDFVQRQTITNKQAMENGAATQRAAQARMAAILADDAARRDYLLQQSMYKSLQQEREIV